MRHAAHHAGKKVPAQYAKPFGEIQLLPDRLMEPLHWRKPQIVGVVFGADLFHERVPDDFRERVFAVATLCPQHEFIFLSKRSGRMAEYAQKPRHTAPRIDGGISTDIIKNHISTARWPLPNVWLGFTAEDQQRFDERWAHMHPLAEAGWKVWASMEPLLGPINKGFGHQHLSRVIAGGESGKGARECNVDWIRDILGQCEASGVKAYCKQLGSKPIIRAKPCPDCNGIGDEKMPCGPGDTKCEFCNGTGYLNGEVPTLVRDRAGADPKEWPKDLKRFALPSPAEIWR